MNNREIGSVHSLMSKLASLKGELSSDEQEAFSDIVSLAARSARELREEELNAAVGGAVRVISGDGSRLTEIARVDAGAFLDVGLLAKPQSSHPTLVAEQLQGFERADFVLPDVGLLAKPQSSHPTLIAEQLQELDRSQFTFPDVGALAKPQSSHPTLVAEQLQALQTTFKPTR
jgi:hypothetical protein